MLESSSSCPTPNYSPIVHSPKGVTFLALQLNYLANAVLELKVELAKIKAKVKEIKKQLVAIHLSLVNMLRRSENLY